MLNDILEVINKVEWVWKPTNIEYCPICLNNRIDNHKENCKMAIVKQKLIEERTLCCLDMYDTEIKRLRFELAKCEGKRKLSGGREHKIKSPETEYELE